MGGQEGGRPMANFDLGSISGGGGQMLNEQQQARLLEIARQSMETFVREQETIEVTETDPELMRKCGAFVTLKKSGQLRGCIGHIEAVEPLYLTVRDMAIAGATQDWRFPPVIVEELSEIDIEVSVLSELEKITDVNQIEVGVHGVVLEKGGQKGVFLPQVAPEQGWNRVQLLDNLCAHKMGLPADAWREGADIYIYTAQVFGEREQG